MAIIICVVLIVLPLSWAQDRSQLERILKRQYKDKVLTQRRFLSGAQLHYLEDGTSEDSAVGPWTTDAELRVTRVNLPNERTIQIQGKRLFLVYTEKCSFRDVQMDRKGQEKLNKHQIEAVKKQRNVTVSIRSADAWDEAKARAALARVFLRPDEHLSSFVPEYWTSFLRACEEATSANAPTPLGSVTPVGVWKVGADVSAPRALAMPDPEYSDLARAAKFQGTGIISVVVGTDGLPGQNQISRPLGLGLDENAVAAVRQWKFAPAMREGKPVPVQINVEVTFRIY